MQSDDGKKPKKTRWMEKFRYRFDNIMARGTLAKAALLLVFSLLVIFCLALIDYLIERSVHKPMTTTFWDTMNHTFDPGNLYGDDRSRGSLAIMLIATIFGMFFTATLISIINNGLEARMDALSKGHSKVLEKGHTIVLGFSEITYAILAELIRANENQSVQTIVVMDMKIDIDVMEEKIQQHMNRFIASLPAAEQKAARRHTRIVCRSGHIYSLDDLSMCSIETCSSVIVNSIDDSHTLKAIMACASVFEKLYDKAAPGTKVPHITAMVMKRENQDAAIVAGGKYLELVCYEDLMSRIIASSSRYPGLSYVYTEIFNYAGQEFYCVKKDDIPLGSRMNTDMTLYDLNQLLPSSIAVGGIDADTEHEVSISEKLSDPFAGKKSCLAPTMDDIRVRDLEFLYLIEEDDNSIAVLPQAPEIHLKAPKERAAAKSPVHYAIVGCGPLILTVLERLSSFLAPGTRVTIIGDGGEEQTTREKQQAYGKAGGELHIKVESARLDRYHDLYEAIPADATSIMVLSDAPTGEDQALADKEMRPVEDVIDERTLSRLVFLRQIREDRKINFSITCEINLDRNRRLAEYTGAEDYIVGSRVTALIMTQIAQTRELHRLFAELMDPFGTEIYFRRVGDFMDVSAPEGITLFEAAAALQKQNEVFIGYSRLISQDSGRKRYEIPVLNPPKYERYGNGGSPIRCHFRPDDRFVVLSSNSYS